MKTILVPSDFSKASRAATLYAAQLAKNINAKIILLNIVNSEPSPQSLMTWRKLEHEMLEELRKNAEQLIGEIRAQVDVNINIKYEAIPGFPIQKAIENFAKTNDIALIVIGTRGAGFSKMQIGSNALAVINTSSVPVITVPEAAKYRSIRNIVYATDLAHSREEIRRVTLLARPMHSEIHVLHVNTKDTHDINAAQLEREMIKVAKYPSIHVHVATSEDVVTSVDSFVQTIHADLLVMFTHKVDLFEKLFGKSLTRNLAFRTEIPLLTFNKANEPFAIMQGWEFAFNFE